MLTLTSKALQPEDYTYDIRDAVARCHLHGAMLQGTGWPLGYPHGNRIWEYASALEALAQLDGSKKQVVEAGCGRGLLTPMLAAEGHNVVACDPDPKVAEVWAEGTTTRDQFSQYLAFVRAKFGTHPGTVRFEHGPIAMADSGMADAAFAISVMEHIPEEEQLVSWRRLARCVRPGGLLFVTVDYEESGRPPDTVQYAEAREILYTKEKLEILISALDSLVQFTPIDLTYHGDQVYNYTFFRLVGLVK